MFRRVLVWGVVVAAVAAASWWLMRPQPVAVEMADVVAGTFRVVVEADGRTRVRDRYVVSAPISARVERSTWRPGDRVTDGQAVAILQPNLPPLLDPRARRELEERLGAAEALVDEAEALHARARVALDQARTNLERTRQLRAREVATLATLERDTFAAEQAERDLRAAERRVHAAGHQRAEAEEALRRTASPGRGDAFTVTAPVAGTILRLAQESEAPVQPGTQLVEIGDPTDLEIVADLLTTDAVRLQPGARVEIVRWGGPRDLVGRVRRVEPSGFTKVSALGVEEQRVWVVVDLVSPPAERPALGDGFRVELRLVVEDLDNATIVPIGALFRRGESWQAFVVENGVARLRSVEVARRSGRMAAIASGIAPGETVILFPPNAVSEGRLVAPLTSIGR